jgi:glycine/D-amino acid oxidase-like deaminating enzyme
MVRARMAVDRAIEEGLIGPQRRLLVIGAGAAGATAAIHSASRGVPVVLIEAAPAPFLRQAGCRSRWIDPVQYDWPVDHWPQGRYPWTPPAMPLPWARGAANQIALAWALALHQRRRRHPNLMVLFSSRLLGRPLPAVAATLRREPTDAAAASDAALSRRHLNGRRGRHRLDFQRRKPWCAMGGRSPHGWRSERAGARASSHRSSSGRRPCWAALAVTSSRVRAQRVSIFSPSSIYS